MTVTTERPRIVAPDAPRRGIGPFRIAICVLAALATVAVLVRVVRDDGAPLPAAFDAVWFEVWPDDNEHGFSVQLAARRFPHDPVYFDGHVMAAADEDSADLARDGRHFAYLPYAAELRVLTLPTQGVRVLTVPDDATHPAWSPDLRTIALSSKSPTRTLYLVDVATGSVRTVSLGPGVRTVSYRLFMSWSPDGTMLAVTAEDGIHVVRPDGTLVRRLPRNGVTGSHAWSPDGTRLLAYPQEGGPSFYVVDAVTGRRLTSVPFTLYDTAWTTDGGFVRGDTHEVTYYDARGEVVRREPTGYAGRSHAAIAFSVRPAT